jgi:hypothetical protein
MSNENDKAGLPLSQTKLTTEQQTALTERLSKLENRLHNLLACYQFYDHAIRAITNPDQLDNAEDWYFGLFLNQQWLRQQGERVMAELVDIKVAIKT